MFYGADLRIDGGEFRQNPQGEGNLTTGRLDSRFSGPDIDPLAQRADYDPQASALGSAYVSAFNDYARKDLQLNAGHFDLATPFNQGIYEMHHLPMPQNLQSNVEFRFYESGHMVYAKDASLKQLHDNVADFIHRTSGGDGG